MKVAIVCPYDMGVHGGVQSHVYDMVAALHARSHEVAVLAPVSDPTALARARGEFPTWLTSAGSSRRFAINGSYAPVRIGMRQRAQVRRWLAAEQPDVLHVHEPFVPALSRPAVHAARTIAVVGTFHAAVPSTKLLRALRFPLARTARKLSATIAVSDAAAATVTAVVPHQTLTVIPNPVAISRFARAVIDKPPVPKEGGHILFLGRGDEPRKGLTDLLTALPFIFAARPHVKVHIAGRMNPANLPASVDYLGEVPESDKPGVYACADVYVAPHRGGESMGLVLVEAMAAGTAVVATDLPAFVAVSQDGECAEHVPVHDPVALAAGILRVLDDSSRRESLVHTGLRRAQDFDAGAIAEQLIAVYEGCLR